MLASYNLAQGLAGNDQRSVFPKWRHGAARAGVRLALLAVCSCKNCNIQGHLAKNCLKMARPWALLPCEESRFSSARDVRASDSFQALLDSSEVILPHGDLALAKLCVSILDPEAAGAGTGCWVSAAMLRLGALSLLSGPCSRELRCEPIRLAADSSSSETWGHTFFFFSQLGSFLTPCVADVNFGSRRVTIGRLSHSPPPITEGPPNKPSQKSHNSCKGVETVQLSKGDNSLSRL